MAAKPITEKQIVDHIIKNWEKLFEPGLHFFKREVEWLEGWKCDITAWFMMEYEGEPHKAAVFMEAKYDSPSRDLIYELCKALTFVNRHKAPSFVAVISDDFSDPYIQNFIKENQIFMFQVIVENQDLETMKIKYIQNTGHFEIQDKV